jgi:hypothetical protein
MLNQEEFVIRTTKEKNVKWIFFRKINIPLFFLWEIVIVTHNESLGIKFLCERMGKGRKGKKTSK